MIHRLSEKIAFLYSEKGIIDENMKEVYAYGFELLIATLLTGFLTLGIAKIFGVFYKTIILLVPFALIRSKAGGYHAKTHIGCILSFISTYILSIWLLGRLNTESYFLFSLISIIASLTTVMLIGCIPNENRPVTDAERKEFSIKSRFLSLALSFTGFLLVYLAPTHGIYFSAGIAMAAGSMIIEKFSIKREENRNEKIK